MKRKSVPAGTKRRVLVEAGHRCAIPTCRETTTEIAHIVPWSESEDNSFENLIALCPNCHSRYDDKKEIDRDSIKMYKANLGIINNRYGEFERRVFGILAESGKKMFAAGPAGDVLVANAVKDGFFELVDSGGMSRCIPVSNGETMCFPNNFIYRVTDLDDAFIEKFASGKSLD